MELLKNILEVIFLLVKIGIAFMILRAVSKFIFKRAIGDIGIETAGSDISVKSYNKKLEKNVSALQNADQSLTERLKSLNEKYNLDKDRKQLPNIYFIDFVGDVLCRQAYGFGQIVTAILRLPKSSYPDEVVLNVTSPGGSVIHYGLMSSHVQRLLDAGINFTTAADTVSASGGYMISCMGNKAIAAPYAIIGSIGVVVEFPNFYDLLNRLGVKFLSFTAGKNKRGITPFTNTEADNYPEKEKKTEERLHVIHEKFKSHVLSHRRNINENHELFEGDNWYAFQTNEKKFGLIDEIKTSEQYLSERVGTHDVYTIAYKPKKIDKKLKLAFAKMTVYLQLFMMRN